MVDNFYDHTTTTTTTRTTDLANAHLARRRLVKDLIHALDFQVMVAGTQGPQLVDSGKQSVFKTKKTQKKNKKNKPKTNIQLHM